MTVDGVNVLPAASRPGHPDHDRWVKEQMLAREVSFIRGLGLEVRSRDVDTVINEGMRRLAARKRERRMIRLEEKRKPPPRDPATNVAGELAAREGYKFAKRAPRARPAPYYECARCGRCVRCKRERRATNILRMGHAGDARLRPLALIIIHASVRANTRAGEFAGLGPHDVNRVLTRIIEDVCDRSVPIGGAWR